MKLFAATLAIASAQDFAASEAGDDARTFSFGDSAFDYGDSAYGGFGNSFYDSAYGSDYNSLAAAYNYDDADAAAADADAAVANEQGRDKDEARYFGIAQVTTPGITTTTFTTTPRNDRYCLKCDVMKPSDCAIAEGLPGAQEECEPEEVCFLEVRRSSTRAPSGKKVTQICTGCKHKQACWDLKQQNSIKGFHKFRDLAQCHPMHDDTLSPRLGDVASVCRTCFEPSDETYADADPVENKYFAAEDDDTFTIPNGAGSTTVTLYGSDDDAFNTIWFTSRHGIPYQSSYDLDFSMAALA